eukprot:GFUD01035208.1.p1 GENE.GFUD01035208.1~~GFUD01035208.1.p1  ORF type:complete len:637 (+),score=103.36 GFUD01035208.1:231-1913(+)
MEVAEAMARERDAMQRAQDANFGPYSQRLSNNSKLGINTNIYSLYQNSQSKQNRSSAPDVTISQVPSPGYGVPEIHRPEPGRSDMTLSKVPDYPRPSSVSPNGQHMMNNERLQSKSRVSEQHSTYSESQERQSYEGEDPGNQIRESIDSNVSETLFSSCMQEKTDNQLKGVADSSTLDEENPATMEPDSSTDDQESRISGKESHISYNNNRGNNDALKDQGNTLRNGFNTKDASDSDYEGEDDDELRMQLYKKEQAKMFNIKPEPDAKRHKAFKTPQEELTELMKLTNEKLFRNSNRMGANHLPLSVEIEELDSSSDSVSPPRNMSNPFMPNSMVTNSLSPRKRGRKPKHYSEILFELGQRGISITKTNKPNQNPGEMVVSESGSVSHKTGGQQLKCPHCNKILTTSVGLMYHIRLHTGEKPYSCDLCGKSFATSSHYHYHIRSHSGEKPYRCDFCGKMYTASGSLRLHLKSHLSRLAANAFNTMNMPGFPMGQNGSMGLSNMPQDPLHVGPNDFKFGIKQEVFENDTNEAPNPETNLALEGPKNNEEVETNNFQSEQNN